MVLLKVHIGNARFTTSGFPDIMAFMQQEIERKQRKLYAAVTNIHVMVQIERDPELARIINGADICLCDSASVFVLGKREGKSICRCYGPDYVVRCCEYGVPYGWRHFFFGGAETVAERMAEQLQKRFPGMQIAGTFCPPFRDMREDEVAHMVEAINRSKADIVWVGLGAGKQDKWIAQYINSIEATWFSGVGAAFDFISGNTKRAPATWQHLGLEWLYRFAFEPRRLLIRNCEGAALLFRFGWRSLISK